MDNDAVDGNEMKKCICQRKKRRCQAMVPEGYIRHAGRCEHTRSVERVVVKGVSMLVCDVHRDILSRGRTFAKAK